MTRLRFLLLFAAVGLCAAAPARDSQSDPRLRKAFRKPAENGWIFVHLEGTPSEIGFQHGYLLAPEIEDAQKAIALGLTHEVARPLRILPRGRRKGAVAARRSRSIARS